MKNFKLFGIAFTGTTMCMAGAALAVTILLIGNVYGLITLPRVINAGPGKVNEEKTLSLFIVNSSINTPVYLVTTCDNPGRLSAAARLPVGSTYTGSIPLIIGGNTTLPANITEGEVQLVVRYLAQGSFNCTIDVVVDPLTNTTFVQTL